MLQATGRISDMVGRMKLQQKFRQRMSEPGFGDDEKASLVKEAENADKAKKLAGIEGKLRSGRKLAAAELEYLRKHSPDMYKKAVKIAKEREAYRERLKNCKSKAEVEQLNQEKTQSLATEARAVEQSSMSSGDKQGALDFIGMRMAAIQNEHTAFIAGTDYQKLPEDSDKKPAASAAISQIQPQPPPQSRHQAGASPKNDDREEERKPIPAKRLQGYA